MLPATLLRHRGTAMRFPEAGGWAVRSYPEVVTRGRELARGLVACGLAPGDRVAILGTTRPEWTLADLAVLWAGGAVVPIYHTNSPEECEHVLRDSGARAVLCEDAEQLEKIAAVRERLPALEHVLELTGPALDELAARGRDVEEAEIDARVAALEASAPATIVYTSGTTGAPKGCVLTHGNLRAVLDGVGQMMDFGPEPRVFYLWLPLAHVLARIVQLVALEQGAELAYWRRDTKRLLDDVAELQPTHLPSVPRVFEKIHTAARAGAQDSPVRARMLDWALAVGGRRQRALDAGRSVPPALAAAHAVADRLVLRRIRGLFGGRLRFAITGAAPIDPEILRFFHAAGVYVLEGYGLTECTAVATVNTVAEHRFGTVGRPLPGCELRIADDGELLIRGPNVFAGYFEAPEATADAVSDGWLHTGDLGSVDVDGYLSITGRKKEILITSSGKNVTPASIENALMQDRWIGHAVVFGDRRPYITALLTLDPDEVPALAERLGLPADAEALAGDERVRAELQQAVDAANARFARVEQIKRFAILPRDLSQEEGELTPTAKVRRAAVAERHAALVDDLYDG